MGGRMRNLVLSLILVAVFLLGCAAQQPQAPAQQPAALPQANVGSQPPNGEQQNSTNLPSQNETKVTPQQKQVAPPVVSETEQIQSIIQYCQNAGGLWIPKAEASKYSIKIGIPLPPCQQHASNCFDSNKLDELNETCVNPDSRIEEATNTTETTGTIDARKQCSDAGYIFVPNEEAYLYNAKMNIDGMNNSNETCVSPNTDFRSICIKMKYIFVPNAQAQYYSSRFMPGCVESPCVDSEGNVMQYNYTLNETCVKPDSYKGTFESRCTSEGWILVPNAQAAEYSIKGYCDDQDCSKNLTCVRPDSKIG